MIALVIAVVVVGSVAAGVNLYLHKGNNTLEKAYMVQVTQPNGTVVSFNLSSVGGYAYVPQTDNGKWVIGSSLDRIVSLIPSVSSTLYALHAYSNLVGVDQYSVYPTPGTNVTVFNIEVGSIPVEAITNLSPDAIITTIGGFSQQDINQVVNVLGIPYIVMDPANITQIEAQNTILGYMTGSASNASLVNNWMNLNLQDLQKSLSSVNTTSEASVFYDLGSGSGGLYTAGTGTFINNMIGIAHLKNIVNESGYPVVPISYVYNESPQFVLLDQYVTPSDMNASLSGLGAVQNGSYVGIVNDTFFDEPNFRTVYSIYWLAEKFYPALVNMSSIVGFNGYTGLNLGQNPEVGVNS